MTRTPVLDATPPVLTIVGPRATITLNRPAKLNRLEQQDLDQLLVHFDTIESDRSIRVVILTGAGRAFSAGFDLQAIASRATSDSTAGESSQTASFERVADCLEGLERPTICRLNGGVYGGSTDLALACDFRIGSETCEMFMPAARLGLHYYAGGLRRYVARLGADNAKRLFLTADRIDSAEMLRIGYLTSRVSADDLDGAVDRLTTTLAGNAPLAMRGMKRAINDISHGAFDVAAASARHRDSLRGHEIREGSAAFSEKRKPLFSDPD